MRLENKWITGSSKVFDLSIFLRSCLQFSSFLSFSRALTLGCVLVSFARTLRLSLVRGCALSLAFRFVFGLAFAFPLAFHLGCPLGCPRVVTFFELPAWEFLRLPPFGTFLRAETTSCAFTSSCTEDAVVTISFTQDETYCSSNCSGWRFESSSLVFALSFRCFAILSGFFHCFFHDTFVSFLVQFGREVLSPGLKPLTWVHHH